MRIDAAALPLVVRAGAGSARDSLSVLDQLLGGAGPDGVTYEVATGLLGYTPDNLLDEVIDAFAAQDGAGVFGVVDKVIETGQDPRRFTEDVLRRLRDLVIVSAVPEAHASGLLDAPQDQAERLVAQAARFGRADLVRAADLVAAGLTEMRGATTPRLLLELLCAKVLLPGADHAELGLMARMDRLERRLDVAGSGPLDVPARRARPAAGRPRAHSRAAGTRSAGSPRRSRPPLPGLPEEPASTGPRLPEEVAQRPSRGADPQQPPAPPTAPAAQAAPAEAGEEAPGQLSLADVRRLWPDLLEQVKRMRRFTWILLSQNAQVIGVDQRSLTVGFKTAGARDSFLGGGSEEILRQAAIDMVGADWKIETVVDSSADPGAQTALRVTRPAVPEAPEPSDSPEPPDPGPARARSPTPRHGRRPAAPPGHASPPPAVPARRPPPSRVRARPRRRRPPRRPLLGRQRHRHDRAACPRARAPRSSRTSPTASPTAAPHALHRRTPTRPPTAPGATT